MVGFGFPRNGSSARCRAAQYPMSPAPIVAGKLVAAWAFVFWLALMSLPFLALGVIWSSVDVGPWLEGSRAFSFQRVDQGAQANCISGLEGVAGYSV
jgi:hypothetical protein